jgi:uncharacterized membrane protein YsdA (DUF1294 family)
MPAPPPTNAGPYLFFVIMGLFLTVGAFWVLSLDDDATARNARWPFSATALGVTLLVIGVVGLVYGLIAFISRLRK